MSFAKLSKEVHLSMGGADQDKTGELHSTINKNLSM